MYYIHCGSTVYRNRTGTYVNRNWPFYFYYSFYGNLYGDEGIARLTANSGSLLIVMLKDNNIVLYYILYVILPCLKDNEIILLLYNILCVYNYV